MTRISTTAQAAALALVLGAGAATAADAPAEPQCRQALPDAKQTAEQAGISPQKKAQIASLLEQVDRACQQNDDVVAMAGIDQVREIVAAEQKSRSGSSAAPPP
jgi:hypothetical protein